MTTTHPTAPTEPHPTPITAARLHAAAVLLGGGLHTESFAEFRRGMALLGQPVTPTEALLLLGDPDGALTWAALAERATRYDTGD